MSEASHPQESLCTSSLRPSAAPWSDSPTSTWSAWCRFAGGWWGSGWLEASLLLFIAAGVLAVGGLDKIAKRLVAAAEAAPDGAITPALDAQRHDPRSATIESYLLGIDLAIVFLMTNKPGFAGAGVAIAAALAVGAVVSARERRHAPAAAPA